MAVEVRGVPDACVLRDLVTLNRTCSSTACPRIVGAEQATPGESGVPRPLRLATRAPLHPSPCTCLGPLSGGGAGRDRGRGGCAGTLGPRPGHGQTLVECHNYFRFAKAGGYTTLGGSALRCWPRTWCDPTPIGIYSDSTTDLHVSAGQFGNHRRSSTCSTARQYSVLS